MQCRGPNLVHKPSLTSEFSIYARLRTSAQNLAHSASFAQLPHSLLCTYLSGLSQLRWRSLVLSESCSTVPQLLLWQVYNCSFIVLNLRTRLRGPVYSASFAERPHSLLRTYLSGLSQLRWRSVVLSESCSTVPQLLSWLSRRSSYYTYILVLLYLYTKKQV